RFRSLNLEPQVFACKKDWREQSHPATPEAFAIGRLRQQWSERQWRSEILKTLKSARKKRNSSYPNLNSNPRFLRRAQFAFRPSAFFRLSVFGFRTFGPYYFLGAAVTTVDGQGRC